MQKGKPHNLDDAIAQLRTSLNNARQYCEKNGGECKSNLLVSSGEVTLALSQSSTGTIGVSIPVGTSTFSAGSSNTKGSVNTITLKFENPLFASKDSAAIRCVMDKDGLLLPVMPAGCKTYQVAAPPAPRE